MKPYYQYKNQELISHSRIPLIIASDNDQIFKALAQEMVATIEANNANNQPTVIICPVGPIGHYPYFVDMVNTKKLSLHSVWFINMDEYLTADKEWVLEDHPLSFRGFMKRTVYSQIDKDLVMPESQRLFPDPLDLSLVERTISQLGKVDLCLGGIGINGHVAFNEPEPNLSHQAFMDLPTRVLPIAPETRAINSVGDLRGAIEDMPRDCVSIGMREIMKAKKIRLGVFRDWHYAVIRRAVCAQPSPEFPVTLLQSHPDIEIYLNKDLAN
ncbi:6-phosphogluconolactonase [Streptococcus plurextorum]|uniref:6-phosphogluconolactonase n=1 Tax=Streptococcus plurextorum TaxID=456876 RepID=UPI00041C1614|nr:glucosamine-6-phosphate isomerase [Streptococcus plurextorum]